MGALIAHPSLPPTLEPCHAGVGRFQPEHCVRVLTAVYFALRWGTRPPASAPSSGRLRAMEECLDGSGGAQA